MGTADAKRVQKDGGRTGSVSGGEKAGIGGKVLWEVECWRYQVG